MINIRLQLLGGRGASLGGGGITAGSLPQLTGTPKQVEWAERIRGEYIRRVEEYLNEAPPTDRKPTIEESNRWEGFKTITSIERMRDEDIAAEPIKGNFGGNVTNPEEYFTRKLKVNEAPKGEARAAKRQQAREAQRAWEREKLLKRLNEKTAAYWIDNWKHWSPARPGSI